MDLTALQAAVKTRMAVPGTDALFTSAVLTDLINSALHYIETEADWPWLEASETITTTNTTDAYTPNANWRRTIDLRLSTGHVLRRIPVAELDFYTGTGEPRLYAIYANQLVLRPTPVTSFLPTILHRYIRKETDLASGSDTPLMDSSYHSAIVEYATFLAHRRQAKTAEADAALAAYETWRDQMIRRAHRWSDDTGGGSMPTASDAGPAATPAK